MSEYTPITDRVRNIYASAGALGIRGGTPGSIEYNHGGSQFDRWLGGVKREAKAQALEEASNWLDAHFQSMPRWNEAWAQGTRTRQYEDGAVDAICDVMNWLRTRAAEIRGGGDDA